MSAVAPGYVIGYLENVDVGPEIIEYIDRIEGTFEPYGGRWLVHNMPHVNHEGHFPGPEGYRGAAITATMRGHLKTA